MPTQQEQQLASLLPAMMAMAAELMAAQLMASGGVVMMPSCTSNPAHTAPMHSNKQSPSSTTSQSKGEEAESTKKRASKSRKRVHTVEVGNQKQAQGHTQCNEPKSESSPMGISPLSSVCSPSGTSSTSSSAATATPTSLPDGAPSPKIRKLKLYSVDEKIDIIDYAKVIGNRAAGREFNVAESSIREWRKNEERLRRQMEQPTTEGGSTGQPAHHFESENPSIIDEIDAILVEFINSGNKESIDWYSVRDKGAEVWAGMAKEPDTHMNISMGWVARFMSRSESKIPKLAPPIIATSNNGGSGTPSTILATGTLPNMVRPITNTNPLSQKVQSGSTALLGDTPVAKRGVKRPCSRPKDKCKEQPRDRDEATTSQKHDDGASSRRKSRQPRRVEHGATLLTTTPAGKSVCPPLPMGSISSPAAQQKVGRVDSVSDLLAIWLMKNCQGATNTCIEGDEILEANNNSNINDV